MHINELIAQYNRKASIANYEEFQKAFMALPKPILIPAEERKQVRTQEAL